MRKDDKGYTLIELIVVLAIMAILMSMLIIGLAILPATAAKGCANGLKTFIGQTRILTMGKQETVLEFYRDSSNGRYYVREFAKSNDASGTSWTATMADEECGRSNITVSYHIEDSSDPIDDSDLSAAGYTEMNKGDVILFTFDRGKGSLKASDSTALSGLDALTYDGSNESQKYDCIKVSGGATDYYVRIHTATGKVVLK